MQPHDARAACPPPSTRWPSTAPWPAPAAAASSAPAYAPMCVDAPPPKPPTGRPPARRSRRAAPPGRALRSAAQPQATPSPPLDTIFTGLPVGVKTAFGGVLGGAGRGGAGEGAPPPPLMARYSSSAALSPDELASLAAGVGVETNDRLSESPPGEKGGGGEAAV